MGTCHQVFESASRSLHFVQGQGTFSLCLPHLSASEGEDDKVYCLGLSIMYYLSKLLMSCLSPAVISISVSVVVRDELSSIP